MGIFSFSKRKSGSSTLTESKNKKTGKTSRTISSTSNGIRRSVNLSTGKVRNTKVK